MAQYLPIFAMLVLAVVFAASAAWRPAARAAPADDAEAAPYECGIVPRKRAARALPGAASTSSR